LGEVFAGAGAGDVVVTWDLSLGVLGEALLGVEGLALGDLLLTGVWGDFSGVLLRTGLLGVVAVISGPLT
jgi:hypothetical protein